MWHGILGHESIIEHFRQRLASGRLASTYLFVGPEGIGKRTLAMKLAQALLCRQSGERELEICGVCESCRLAEAGTHPDLHLVGKPADRSFIPLELLIGPPDRRMREGLCHEIAMKPFLGGRKAAIIDDADLLNQEGANALLKTLEEPPPRSVLILIGRSASRQLPTIRSRCQIVRFGPLPRTAVSQLLLDQQIVTTPDDAESLAMASGGSLSRAIELADPDMQQFRSRLTQQLAQHGGSSLQLARDVAEFVDTAKDATGKRQRMRQAIECAMQHYAAEMRASAGSEARDDPEASPRSLGCAAKVERCLDALYHVDRFANPTTLIESWLYDLLQPAIR